MKNCIYHGKYVGSTCDKCDQNYLDNHKRNNPNFILFIIKNSIIMGIGIAIGWLIFTI